MSDWDIRYPAYCGMKPPSRFWRQRMHTVGVYEPGPQHWIARHHVVQTYLLPCLLLRRRAWFHRMKERQ